MSDNIELRSEKVRNIIGQIPPRIIRIGISVIFVIIVCLLLLSYFFQYNYTIKTKAIISKPSNITIVEIKIPANEISKVKVGHKVILDFNNIPNLYNKRIETEVQNIPNKLEISNNGGFVKLEIKIADSIKINDNIEIDILNPTEINADIITDKISFFDKLIAPFTSLVK